ncbi:glycosyltransferase family 9 protein [Dyella solisilvae]|uniref:glycosyltransferase family 9 protein n=1 Tax=Dyella solisilvae TaxID=1920168 RepID=UPI0013145944|nr:glycosyltransferase family 9 protein [Dyella solisilvae]
MLTPLIAELERLYKGVEIDILSEGDIAEEVFSTFFSVKNIYCLPKRGFKRPVSFLATLFRVRKVQYDLIVDPCLGSGFARAVTGFLKGRFKLGFSDKPADSKLTHPVPTEAARQHMAQRPINLLRWARQHYAGVVDDATDYPSLDIRLTDTELAQGRAVIEQLSPASQRTTTSPVVGIFGNATGAKRYPAEWWNEFITTFKEMCPASSLIELIPMHGRSMLGDQWPGYYSTDIRRMGAVMAGMDLFITADCGVMHLAVASRVPTVGMFSVTDASVYEPYGCGSRALLTKGLSARETAMQIVRDYATVLGQAGPVDAKPATATTPRAEGINAPGELGQLGLTH